MSNIDLARGIITIGREYGSGGRFVAKRAAEILGIPFYDKELIELAAQETGMSPEFIKKAEEHRSSPFIFSTAFADQTLPLADQVFIAQANIIKDIASRGPCIFVGRCSDYILKDVKGSLSVFVHAPMEERILRVRKYYAVEGTDAAVRSTIVKWDKKRAAYYDHFTMMQWGLAQNYHMTISTTFGIEDAALAIIAAAKGRSAQ